MPVEEAVANERHAFYCKAANLVVNINPGQIALENGIKTTVGEKTIEFGEFREGWGVCYTKDPEVIANLKARGDVYEEPAYREMVLSPDARAKLTKDENTRILTENNRLAKLLEEQKADNEKLAAKLNDERSGSKK